MDLRFNNYARHVGTRTMGKGDRYDWYEWMVFMDEPPDTLQSVDSVEYRLHPTFPNPVRLIDDRASRFALRSSGWGQFRISITIYLIDGSFSQAQYELDLSKNWPIGVD